MRKCKRTELTVNFGRGNLFYANQIDSFRMETYTERNPIDARRRKVGNRMTRGKKIAALLMSVFLLLGAAPVTLTAAAAGTAWEMHSVTWQDPGNAVLIWQASDGYTYRIYRADSENGSYEQIGTSTAGSYRDAQAAYPKASYYKVEPVSASGKVGVMSEPMRAGTNPQKLSRVSVLMYHDFITEEDIANGVKFGEYALDPVDFEADLQYFKQNGYTTITSADLIAYIYGEKPLPAKAIILSIDDGTLGVYTNAWPLLKKYRMKADFNVIGDRIDEAWQTIYDGGTREGTEDPYCQWNELKKMVASDEINLCSHTYGMHYYNLSTRIGEGLEGDSLEEYIANVKEDYRLIERCMTGWTGVTPKTMAYPYSIRSSTTDAVILENTGYEILMAGTGARRNSASNYFVDGADPEAYQRLMNRPYRMDGHPAQEYLDELDRTDEANGVNHVENTAALSAEICRDIAAHYSPYADVAGSAWYGGAVYYTYVNSILSGTSLTTFSPEAKVSRAMAAMLLYRMAGEPAVSGSNMFTDVPAGQWYTDAVCWAAENDIVPAASEQSFAPDAAISREQLVSSLYQYAVQEGMELPEASETVAFADESLVSPWATDAVRWAAACGLVRGDEAGRVLPQDDLTRAQLAVILQTWGQYQADAV